MADMKTITVYGASDDLLEVDGDFSMEADCYDAPPMPVLINGQHALTVTYTNDGLWKIDVVDLPENVTIVNTLTAVNDSETSPPRHPAPFNSYPSYSDIITLTGPITSVEGHGAHAYPR